MDSRLYKDIGACNYAIQLLNKNVTTIILAGVLCVMILHKKNKQQDRKIKQMQQDIEEIKNRGA